MLLFIAVFSISLLLLNAHFDDSILANATPEDKNNYELLKKIGASGLADGQFKGPIGVAIDSNQNLYVVDSENHRIQKFDSEGNFLTKWGQQGGSNGEFEYPEGVAVDSQNNIYVTDSENHNIQKFDSNGDFITKWGTFGVGQGEFGAERSPVGIVIDSQDNIYVTDYWNDRIQKFDSNGDFLLVISSGFYSTQTTFSKPQAIAVDSKDNVYVTESSNNILKFDSNGDFIEVWSPNDMSLSTLQIPEGIAIDDVDNIYINDMYHDRIQKFSKNGTFITKWETSGIKGTYFEEGLGGIAANSEGKVFVSQFGKNIVEVFTPTRINSVSKDIVDNILDNTSNSTIEDKLITPPSRITEGITDQF